MDDKLKKSKASNFVVIGHPIIKWLINYDCAIEKMAAINMSGIHFYNFDNTVSFKLKF